MWEWTFKKLAWESFWELVWWFIREWAAPAILAAIPVILAGITAALGLQGGIPLFYLWVWTTMVFAVFGLICSLFMLAYAMRRRGLHRFEIVTQDEYDASEKKENVIYFVGSAKVDVHSRT